MPRCGPQGEPAVHLALRAPGMVMNYNMPLGDARLAHARLGEALRTFDVARELGSDQVCNSASRQYERFYRAKLAVRLGLASDDIRAVFDLSEDELALLRAEVSGA
jgi:hypothetical protein